ncbi:MAG: 30S ribosomal protein S8 [Nanoarchaeota archaeon]|nr:30S ribosomal protein S8 [Nanoarchaeota archaeon]MEC8339912.1 30S ribosomal protein S8 [Nanoarchaeota archaeon]
MTLNDPIADALSKINNATKALYKEVELKKSKFLVNILTVLKENGYVGSFEEIEDGKSGKVKVHLVGTINKCSVVKPRYAVKVEELEQYEQRFLPAKGFGVIILSTSKGLLTQNQAKEHNVGGQIVAYCY